MKKIKIIIKIIIKSKNEKIYNPKCRPKIIWHFTQHYSFQFWGPIYITIFSFFNCVQFAQHAHHIPIISTILIISPFVNTHFVNFEWRYSIISNGFKLSETQRSYANFAFTYNLIINVRNIYSLRGFCENFKRWW